MQSVQLSPKDSPPPQLAPLASAGLDNAPPPPDIPSSPVAPEYSPITPRAQPVFPVASPQPVESAAQNILPEPTNGQPPPVSSSIAAPTAEFIPEAPPQPFSSEDAPDAIALRAAISSLQFQKKKAQDDIKALEKTRQQALDDPSLFKSELAAGRLNEEKPKFGGLQAILDQADSDEEEDDDEVVLGAASSGHADTNMKQEEIPDSQTTRPTTSSSSGSSRKDDPAPFARIPGPQNVVRMPYVNWEKYHISGEPLDSMHEQQRKWPGSFAYGTDRGREQVVAAPYSPWQDPLDGHQQKWEGHARRNDSLGTPLNVMTPTTISEHPMETRRRTNH